MDEKLLLQNENDFNQWKSTLPATSFEVWAPDSYPAVVTWSISDDPYSSYWNVDHVYVYPSDFTQEG